MRKRLVKFWIKYVLVNILPAALCIGILLFTFKLKSTVYPENQFALGFGAGYFALLSILAIFSITWYAAKYYRKYLPEKYRRGFHAR